MIAAVTTPYTVPVGLMDTLQLTLLLLVAIGATAVVLIREQVRQVLFDPLSAEQLRQLAGISETILAAASAAPADGDCATALDEPATS